MRTLSGGSGGTPGFQSSSPSSSHSPGFINTTGCANSRERPGSEQLKQDKHSQRGKGLIIIICKSLSRARASVRPPVCTVTSIYQQLPNLYSVENSWPQNLSKFFYSSAKVLWEFRETFAEEFCYFDGRSGLPTLCISAIILVALQNNSSIDVLCNRKYCS